LDYDSVMKVLLVGNYPYDGSMSMQVFAHALERELRALHVDVRLIFPKAVLGKLKPSPRGVGKWLGYIDRFLLFPLALRTAAAGAEVVHMCDHGSSMYCPMISEKPTVVTCHDMLAVRGALGELPEMRASRFGRYLQMWICTGLRRATRVACISQATLHDASRILGRSDHLSVILNGLNYPYRPLDAAEAGRRLKDIQGIEKPFLLHVGGSHARKNREGIIRVFAQVAAKADIHIVFAGEPLTDAQTRLADGLKVSNRIVKIVKPDVSVLEALYNRAAALIFPSRLEGFGWPPIEAQACGCPVVASNIPPIAEVLRDSAALHSLDDEAGMASSILRLVNDRSYRDCLVRLGFENVSTRFQTSRMMEQYLALYQDAVRAGSHGEIRATRRGRRKNLETRAPETRKGSEFLRKDLLCESPKVSGDTKNL
jgi:glycosyltransferase involved in cell wall biosynthesis